MKALYTSVLWCACASSPPPQAENPVTPSHPSYPDQDDDHILDLCDRCPRQAETFDGFEDEDGCPETVVVTDNEDMWGQPIYFEVNTHEIKDAASELLAAQADFYLRHLELERIACLGSASLDEKEPHELAFARAQALCLRYESLGLSPVRLVAYGMKPTATSRPRDRNAVTSVVLHHGRRVARWNGEALESLDDQPRYRREPESSRPVTPICPSLRNKP